jgi:uncharacterized metal-binding protein
MANPNTPTGPIALLPCNGLSARGQVATMAVDQLAGAMDEARCVNIVPLLAGVDEEVAALRGARAVISVAGCSHRCDLKVCKKVLGRDPDDALVVGDLLRADVIERCESTEEEIQQCVLEVSSRLVGILGNF